MLIILHHLQPIEICQDSHSAAKRRTFFVITRKSGFTTMDLQAKSKTIEKREKM